MIYRLYCDDERVASFEYERGTVQFFQPERLELLPMQIKQASAEMFMLWLCERAIDINTFVHRELMQKLLGSRDRAAVSISTNMFSITDAFTCFPEKEFCPRNQLWNMDTQKAVNDFVLVSSDTSLRLKSHVTPDASTDGSFVKTWKYENGEWWLYKIQSAEAVNSELAISRVLLDCGWDAAEYSRDRRKKTIIKSKNFVKPGEFFEPYDSLRYMFEDRSDGDEVIYANIRSLGSSFEQAYRRILLADALFMNTDRHMRNFGVIRSTKTGRILRMAPNFDNNQAYKAEKGAAYNPVLLDEFRKVFGRSLQDRDDMHTLAAACGKVPYLKDAFDAAKKFLV